MVGLLDLLDIFNVVPIHDMALFCTLVHLLIKTRPFNLLNCPDPVFHQRLFLNSPAHAVDPIPHLCWYFKISWVLFSVAIVGSILVSLLFFYLSVAILQTIGPRYELSAPCDEFNYCWDRTYFHRNSFKILACYLCPVVRNSVFYFYSHLLFSWK